MLNVVMAGQVTKGFNAAKIVIVDWKAPQHHSDGRSPNHLNYRRLEQSFRRKLPDNNTYTRNTLYQVVIPQSDSPSTTRKLSVSARHALDYPDR
jgi:hypothetical protein